MQITNENIVFFHLWIFNHKFSQLQNSADTRKNVRPENQVSKVSKLQEKVPVRGKKNLFHGEARSNSTIGFLLCSYLYNIMLIWKKYKMLKQN